MKLVERRCNHGGFGFLNHFKHDFLHLVDLPQYGPALPSGTGDRVRRFPYSESSRRLLTFQYSAGINAVDYEQITIFDKTQETLPQHSLSATLAFTQPWGTASVSLRGSQFLNDLGKNNVTLFSFGNVRLFRGLSFTLFGSVSRVRDQLHLARGGATDEEILLRTRQLGTSYRFRISGGFTYRFGSIFNNIVNPRFGGGGFFF